VLALRSDGVFFYDIDTPVTLARLRGGADTYVAPGQIPRFEAYLSFTGGPTLGVLERAFGAKRAAPLYCAADVDRYCSTGEAPVWDLGYLGTYSPDRQPMLERLLIEPARQLPERRFVVAGPQYPDTVAWPPNVERIEHLPPDAHASFYSRQRFTLNVTRSDMIAAGWSPSVRLFEAAACGTPIISDAWEGLTELLPGGILIATQSQQVTGALTRMPEAERLALAASARASVLSAHSGRVRADELAALLRSGSRRRHDKSAPTKPIAHQLDGAFRS
jgi:spore maturation protein CgeB